jgi:hypothetical protein
MRVLRSDAQYEVNRSVEDLDGPRPGGFYTVDGTKIPIFLTINRNPESRDGVIVCEIGSVEIQQFREAGKEYLPKSGFTFKVTDPRENQDLATQFLARDFEYLRSVPTEHRAELVAKLVAFEVLQKISVAIRNPDRVLVSPITDEQFNV